MHMGQPIAQRRFEVKVKDQCKNVCAIRHYCEAYYEYRLMAVV